MQLAVVLHCSLCLPFNAISILHRLCYPEQYLGKAEDADAANQLSKTYMRLYRFHLLRQSVDPEGLVSMLFRHSSHLSLSLSLILETRVSSDVSSDVPLLGDGALGRDGRRSRSHIRLHLRHRLRPRSPPQLVYCARCL
jgi:hypothetical protein